MTYGTKLRNLRDERKLSQLQVSDFVGVSQPTLNNWEQDLSSPKVKHLPKLAEILEVDIADVAQEGTVLKIMDNSQQTNHDQAVVGFEINMQDPKLLEELLNTQRELLTTQRKLIARLEAENEELIGKKTKE